MKLGKKFSICFLAVTMILSLVACGSKKVPEDSSAAGNDSLKLTLDDAQVRMVYADGSYLLLAYYGPQENIDMHYCNSDGTEFDFSSSLPDFCTFESGWRLVWTRELPETIDAASVGLSVTDYNQESKPSRVFADFGTPMSNNELQEIGVYLINGHTADIVSFIYAYKNNIELTINFIWLGVDHDIRLNTWPFTLDDFQFFTSDGTPLAEAYADYETKIEAAESCHSYIKENYIGVTLKGNREATDEDLNALAALKPYMLFTADDGSTIKIPLRLGYYG